MATFSDYSVRTDFADGGFWWLAEDIEKASFNISTLFLQVPAKLLGLAFLQARDFP